MWKPIIPVSLLALTAFGGMHEHERPIVSLGTGEMILEWTPGGEAVVRISAESEEEELQSLDVFRPDRRSLVDVHAPDRAQNGLAGLEIELREPTLETLLEHYAEGSYEMCAVTVGGNLAVGRAELSFDLPSPPRILHPRPGQVVRASDLTVFWMPDHEAVTYEVQLEQGEDDGLRVKLPPVQNSFRVPRGVLAPWTETALEVTAIGANGNRTVVEVPFMTGP